ncbi:MAG: protease modulator HflC [Sedimentisphaerales bacterium]|nr:protease modulator HflC [Sedimentisphaerales bacterium]
MKKHVGVIGLGLSIVTILLLYMITFTVRWQEKVLVLTFDKISREVDQAGLHWKWPVFQKAVHFDTRIRTLQQQPTEMETRDKQTIIVSVYLNWRISAPRTFYERFRQEGSDPQTVIAKAEETMQGWIADASNVIAEYSLGELVSLDESRFKLVHLETGAPGQAGGMLQRIRDKAAYGGGYGIEILDLGIRKLGVPDDVTKSVFERMREERQAVVRTLLAEGKSQAASIRGDAERDATVLMAQAQAQAKEVMGQGDAEAADYYKAFLKHPKLANFLRRLETLRQTLSQRTTIVLDRQSPPYYLLSRGPQLEAASDIFEESDGREAGAAQAADNAPSP